jgi:transposase
MRDITPEDARHIQDLHRLFMEQTKESSIFRFVFENAPEHVRAKFATKDGKPSQLVARRVVQALTTTTVVEVQLRLNHTTIEKFVEPCIAGQRYARNFVTGTWKTIGRWHHAPVEARLEFIGLYEQTSIDDPFEDRMRVVAGASTMIEWLGSNPHLEPLAELEVQWAKSMEAYKADLVAWEAKKGKKGKKGKKDKPPRRPSRLQREIRTLRKKANGWAPKADNSLRSLERFVRIHDQLRMFSKWPGSSTGRKPSTPKSYTYHPIELVYPGADESTHGWYALCCCLQHSSNVDHVVATGERIDRLIPIYSYCVHSGVEAFENGLKKFHDYRKAQKAGRTPKKKEGPPQFKKDSKTLYVKEVSLFHGGAESLREGLGVDGNWVVECEPGEDYQPYLKIGGIPLMVGDSVSNAGHVRISKSQYRRMRKILAYGGKIAGVTISRRSSSPRRPGDPLPERTSKTTRGKRRPRKRVDCAPKTRYVAAVELTNLPVPGTRDVDPSRIVGIDPGVRKFMTLSDGVMFENLVPLLEPYEVRRKSAQKRLSRWHDPRCPDKKRGRGYRRAQILNTEACDTVAKMRRHLHEAVLDKILTMPYDVIAIEDTDLPSLTRSAKGTVDLPAASGEEKLGRERNRTVLSQGIGQFRKRLIERAKKSGKVVILIPPEYTSWECNTCGEKTDPGVSETFRCSACGHAADVDLNAARNIKDAAICFIEAHGLPPVGGSWSARDVPRS